MRVRAHTLFACSFAVLTMVTASACGRLAMLQAKMAFKDANVSYQAQDYPKAAEKYAEALERCASAGDSGMCDDPEIAPSYFYLANSYDQMYRPSRRGDAQNDQYLTDAIANYELSADRNRDNPYSPTLRRLSLQYLVAAFGPDKANDPGAAEPVLLNMIEEDPQDPTNYFSLGRLYEDSGLYDEAEAIFGKAQSARPNDAQVYMQLAGFYNRQGEFEKTMEALHERAKIEPNNPEAHYYIANYYWDKVYRDFRLTDDEKREFITQGLESVDRALELNPDYIEAITYRGLLLRSQALVEPNRARVEEMLEEADQLQERAAELQKLRVSGVAG